MRSGLISIIINFLSLLPLLKLVMSPEEKPREDVKREAERYIRELEDILRAIRRVRVKYARLIEERLRGGVSG